VLGRCHGNGGLADASRTNIVTKRLSGKPTGQCATTGARPIIARQRIRVCCADVGWASPRDEPRRCASSTRARGAMKR